MKINASKDTDRISRHLRDLKQAGVARAIRELRDIRGETQKAFGEKLGVAFGKTISPQRINAWENGECPPNEKLIELGKLADIISFKKFFWEQAGLDMSEFETAARQAVFAEVDKKLQGEVVTVPICDTLPPGTRSKNLRHISLPASWILNANSTFCIEQGYVNFLSGILEKGDLVIIDGSRKSLLTERYRKSMFPVQAPLFAVYFDPLPDRPPGDLAKRQRTDAAIRSGEIQVKRSSGVRFGWVRLVDENEWLDGSVAKPESQVQHCYLLQPATVEGIHKRGVIVPLTPWLKELPQNDDDLAKNLKSEVNILGIVIGWMKSPVGRGEG